MRASPKAILRPRRRSRPSARISPSLAAARKLTLRSRVVWPTPPAAFSLVVLRAPPTAMSTRALSTPPCTGAPVACVLHLHVEIAPEEVRLGPLAGESEDVGGHGGSVIPKSSTGLKRLPPTHSWFGRLGPCSRRTRTHHPGQGETWRRESASSERGPSARSSAAC